MTGDPAISVVMPVYDAGRYLTAAIDSMIAQSLGDFELIAIDDGSSDGSATVLSDYAARDPRIRVLRQPHRGLVSALNRGCDAARAPLIARMDADDIADRDRLARQAAYLSANPDIAVLGSAVRLIDGEGRAVGEQRFPTHAGRIARTLRDGENALAHPTVMFRKATLAAVGGYDPRFAHSEDFELWLRIAARFRIANLPDPLLSYRLHDDSVGTRRRLDQIVAARTAVAVDRLRRAGLPDPVANVERLSPESLDRIPFAPSELADLKLDLGELLLQSLRRGQPDAAVADVARRLVQPVQPTSDIDLIAALFRGGGRGYRSARKAESLARYLAGNGDSRASLAWLARAAWRHRWGPIGLAGGVLRRRWTRPPSAR